MLIVTLPYNPVLSFMKYDKEVLTLGFKKPNNSIQTRSYNANSGIAHKLAYCKSAKEVLSFYSNEIKKKCTVLTVKNI